MLYIPKIEDSLKILTGDEVKDFVAIDFSKRFQYTGEIFYSTLSEEQNLRKVSESLYIFLATLGNVELMQSNSSDNCAHCYNFEVLNTLTP